MSNKADATTMKQAIKRELKPKLRFPEFLDAGEWENDPMGELYTFKGTNSFSRDKLNYERGSVKNIHYGDIHTNFATLFDIRNEKVPYINPSESLENIRPDNYCAEGDMIFADASEDIEDIGKSIELVQLNDERLLSGMHTILARQKEDHLMVGFGGHLFRSIRIRRHIKKESQGTKVLGISAGRLSIIEICYPPNKDEQQKIADCLSSLDELITAEAQQLATLKAHKKGLMQQLFPANHPTPSGHPSNGGEALPRLRFPEFRNAGEWEPNLIGAKTTKIGSGITPTGGEKTYKNEGRHFIRSQNIGWGCLILDDVAFIDEATHSTFPATEIKEGDVFLNITGASIGRSTVADFRVIGGNVNQHVCIIRAKKSELTPYFLNQYLLSEIGQRQIDSFQAGGNRQGLNYAQVRSFSLPLPSIEEQRQVANCLSSIDELITAQTQKLATLKAHKKGLMQQLFPSCGGVPRRGGVVPSCGGVAGEA